MNTPPKIAALIIDGDQHRIKHTEQIIQFCKNLCEREGYGDLQIIKAYKAWTEPQIEKLRKLGVTPVKQTRVGKRNDTDFALAMDVAVMLYKKEANTYFIASNDGDFTVVCQRIRKNGDAVYGIGNKNKASNNLKNFCKQFFDLKEEILKEESEAAPKPATIAKTGKKKSKGDTQPVTTVPKQKAESSKKQNEPTANAAAAAPTPQKTKKQAKSTAKPAVPAPKTKTETPAEPSKKKTKVVDTPKIKPETIRNVLVQAYKATAQKDGWVARANFGKALRKTDTHFAKHFAEKKWQTWLKDFSETFEIQPNRFRMKKK
jgi:uncharacterized LabA/DUF88 family protein